MVGLSVCSSSAREPTTRAAVDRRATARPTKRCERLDRADLVQLRPTAYRVEISTGRRVVRLLHHGRLLRSFRAVVGQPAYPTPHGLFAVSERVAQPDPDGFLGPWALHLTAFSPTLIDFGGGPGTVAIHGRAGASLRDPLGSARSHGCIRIPNEAIRLLARVARGHTRPDHGLTVLPLHGAERKSGWRLANPELPQP